MVTRRPCLGLFLGLLYVFGTTTTPLMAKDAASPATNEFCAQVKRLSEVVLKLPDSDAEKKEEAMAALTKAIDTPSEWGPSDEDIKAQITCVIQSTLPLWNYDHDLLAQFYASLYGENPKFFLNELKKAKLPQGINNEDLKAKIIKIIKDPKLSPYSGNGDPLD